MNTSEVLKLALEALEKSWNPMIPSAARESNAKEAIIAIKEALAQLEERPWVGLTDEEIKAMDEGIISNSSFYAGALWAEAKLKEKNT
jgi:hypothetical protein